VQINRKARTIGEAGLPKVPVLAVRISRGGVEGDFNVYRHERKNDTSDRALLLYPSETLAALNAEGWPVAPGDIGENLTIDGIPYDAMKPGTRWAVGPALVLEISEACNPCKTLGKLPYIGAEKVDRFMATMKGRRGWYARVVKEGIVTAGDAVRPAP
jgi:MOSC domain-containing protein YiiM